MAKILENLSGGGIALIAIDLQALITTSLIALESRDLLPRRRRPLLGAFQKGS